MIDGNATFNFELKNEELNGMVKIGEITFYKQYSTVKEIEPEENENKEISEKEPESAHDNRVLLRIGTIKQKVFEVVKLSIEEAREVRKVLPQLI